MTDPDRYTADDRCPECEAVIVDECRCDQVHAEITGWRGAFYAHGALSFAESDAREAHARDGGLYAVVPVASGWIVVRALATIGPRLHPLDPCDEGLGTRGYEEVIDAAE